MLFCGNEGIDGERKAVRHAMLVENLQQLYTDVFNDWMVANEPAAEELRWLACAIDRYLRTRMKSSQFNFVDALPLSATGIAVSDEPSPSSKDWRSRQGEFAKNPATANLVRDLAFAYFVRISFQTHSGLVEHIIQSARRISGTRGERPSWQTA